VISAVAPDEAEPAQSLNVNADSAASALAIALAAEKLMILTDVPGLYVNWPDTSTLVSSITASELRAMLPSLESGMIPKATACVDAVDGGVPKAAMIDGRVPHGILLEIFTPEGIGTEVVADEGE
jgi:acetylglutamate kinase